MKEKLLVVCGPTAIGKTDVALYLSKVFNGEIISADSRQVYKMMDIGTGKGLSKNSKFEFRSPKLGGFYDVEGVKIWGYDLADPCEDFSVAKYKEFADKIIFDIQKRGKLPILVGGSGLYIKAVVDGIPTISIPPNPELRRSLEGKTKEELFELLKKLDKVKASSMNISDKGNLRRLIRAIEISLYKKGKSGNISEISKLRKTKETGRNVLFIGLCASKTSLKRRITNRVISRIKQGVEKEIKRLLKYGVGWDDQSMQSLGYKEWKEYFMGLQTRSEVVEEWIRDEIQYAKRQMTWFKKDSRILWFDVDKNGFLKDVESVVRKWHNIS